MDLFNGSDRIKICEKIKELYNAARYEEPLTEKEKEIVGRFEDLCYSHYVDSTIDSFFETLEELICFIKENENGKTT